MEKRGTPRHKQTTGWFPSPYHLAQLACFRSLYEVFDLRTLLDKRASQYVAHLRRHLSALSGTAHSLAVETFQNIHFLLCTFALHQSLTSTRPSAVWPTYFRALPNSSLNLPPRRTRTNCVRHITPPVQRLEQDPRILAFPSLNGHHRRLFLRWFPRSFPYPSWFFQGRPHLPAPDPTLLELLSQLSSPTISAAQTYKLYQLQTPHIRLLC